MWTLFVVQHTLKTHNSGRFHPTLADSQAPHLFAFSSYDSFFAATSVFLAWKLIAISTLIKVLWK